MIPLPLTQREAARDDEPFLRALYASTREDELAVVEWPESVLEAFLRLQYDARATDYRRRHPDAVQHLLLVDGEPAGRLWVARAADAWHVLDVALLPAFRGLGFGAHCLQQLLAEATAAGLPVRLQVAHDNPARRLYARLGFVAQGGDDVYQAMTWSPAPFLLRTAAPLSSMET
jgi:ribosomal protein S18 acetylase RimI-like enzyme